jgi:hypothetical protein
MREQSCCLGGWLGLRRSECSVLGRVDVGCTSSGQVKVEGSEGRAESRTASVEFRRTAASSSAAGGTAQGHPQAWAGLAGIRADPQAFVGGEALARLRAASCAARGGRSPHRLHMSCITPALARVAVLSDKGQGPQEASVAWSIGSTPVRSF